ncbi:tannase [Fusarium subglutinans]|uniref:Carboxylic ester hydrolase n=1 Tax=Gibberella subglutinans TaxID=42677 RepID=A0A8H5PBD5_GIBSU|nr:tannase [Fusarium subglutinans]KAF5593550.1 tannase [Fusarium subglutinans]
MARPKSNKSSTASDKPLKQRRSHRKSQNGCGACKQRHMKDAPARGDLFDLSHFALYHHLLTNRHTITSIDPSNESVISHTLDYALKAPYLMNQVLALSALHLSNPPSLQQPYYQLATSLQTRALALFNEEKQEVSEESCVPMFLFSSMVGLHVLCDTLQGPRESFGAVLDRFVTYLSIHRGVRAVTKHSWDTIKTSGLGPVLQQVEDAFPALDNNIEATTILHEMVDANASLSSATKYHDAVSTLQRSFCLHAALSQPNRQRFDAAIAFCLDVDDEYFELLKKRQPEALVILAFFAVLLHWNRSTWIIVSQSSSEERLIDFAVNLVENYNFEAKLFLYYGHPTTAAEDVNFCNVTVTYTHPGQNDTVRVETWLPMDNFNGRLQSVGGGGWVAGRYPPSYAAMSGAISEGYAASTTDAGLQLQSDYGPDSWALTSEGNPNLSLLQNFASISLGDQGWSKASTGKHRSIHTGMAVLRAEDRLFMSTLWPQLIMQELNYFPYPCEMNAILAEAIEACDALDGSIDGIISNVDACDFDPMDVVGKSINCSDTANIISITEEAAKIAKSTWSGPTAAGGKFIWYSPNTGAQLNGQSLQLTSDIGLTMTTCTNETCQGAPVGLGEVWIKYWIEANLDLSCKNMSREAFDLYAHEAIQRYESVIETNDPDLIAGLSWNGKGDDP